ncbi:hypothetical protein [Oceanobacillus manasiensis]|uniref:hypothetical protein n=1 Tax=Oceanobacillus manasiensis TaxID=586413 RepID=UPI0005A6E15A|nr:hypothetical protein [Oceanobacillus manasiensis]
MNGSKRKAEKDDIKKLETHLKNYKTYKAAIRIIVKQLNHLVPGFVSCFEVGNVLDGRVTIESLGKDMDRLSSVKFIKLYEELLHYSIIVASIDEAIAELDETEYQFITSRYLKGKTIVQTSFDLGYSEKYVFNIRKATLNKLLISLKCLIFL